MSTGPGTDPFAGYRHRYQAQFESDLGATYRRESDPSSIGARRRPEENRGSMDAQLRDCQRYATEQGIELVADYVELEQGDVWGRPALQRMLADLRAGKFHHILIQHPDRLSRDEGVRVNFKAAVREAHGKYHFALLPLAAQDTLEGRMVERTSGILSDFEKDTIRRRTQSKRQDRARSGDKIIASGFPKFGYNWVRDARGRILTYEEDAEWSWVVKEVLQRLADGEAVGRMIRDLQARGVPTRGEVFRRKGLLSEKLAARVLNRWNRNAIAEIVFTSDYSGLHLNYHTVSEYEPYKHPITGLDKKRRIPLLRKSPKNYLPLPALLDKYGDFLVPVPPLVDPAVQLAAQYRFLARVHGPRPDSREREDALLAGHVYCGYCRHPMSIRRHKQVPAKSGYFCTHTIYNAHAANPDCPAGSNQIRIAGEREALDAAVWAEVLAGLKSPERLAALLVRAHDVVSDHQDRTESLLTGLRRDLARAENDLAGLVQQSKQPDMPQVVRDTLTAEMKTVGKTIEVLRVQIAAAEHDSDSQAAFTKRVDAVLDWVGELRDGLDSLDYAGKREVLFMLGVRVWVWRKSDPENATDASRGLVGEDGTVRRWRIEVDWEGLNLRQRVGADALDRYAEKHSNGDVKLLG